MNRIEGIRKALKDNGYGKNLVRHVGQGRFYLVLSFGVIDAITGKYSTIYQETTGKFRIFVMSNEEFFKPGRFETDDSDEAVEALLNLIDHKEELTSEENGKEGI